jgi:hypothetical protein
VSKRKQKRNTELSCVPKATHDSDFLVGDLLKNVDEKDVNTSAPFKKAIPAPKCRSVKTKQEIAVSRFRAGQLQSESGSIH